MPPDAQPSTLNPQPRAAPQGRRILPRPHAALLAALAVAIAVSALDGSINAYFLDVAMTAGIAIVMAASLNLINGHTGLFSLGHAGFMAIGAYLSAAVTLFLGPRLAGPDASLVATQFIFLAALLTGGLVAALAGVLIGLPSLRLKGDYLALVTLGFGEIVRVVFQNIPALGGALGLNGIPPLANFAWIYGAAAVTVFTIGCLVNSTYGRGWLATRDNEIAARAIGLDTTRYKITAFAIGAFFAGVAGGLFAHLRMTIDPRGFDFSRSIEIILMVILGGMGNTLGIILAAILLTLLPELLRPVAEYRMVLYSLLLVVLMIVRPQGLLNIRLGRSRS